MHRGNRGNCEINNLRLELKMKKNTKEKNPVGVDTCVVWPGCIGRYQFDFINLSFRFFCFPSFHYSE